MPRSSLADFVAAHDRPDPVALLESQAESRIADLVPVRYGRMLASPFAFYRGAAIIMAADLAASEHTGITVQLCGDAHVSNFGLFGSPERSLVFDINDFDETLPGPWEWDVKRLVASLAVVGRMNGFGREDRERVVRACAKAYRDRMRMLAEMRELDVWYDHTVVDDNVEASVDRPFGQAIRRTAAKARSHDNLEALAKLTRLVDGRRRLVSDPPLLVPIDELVGEAEARRNEQQASSLFDAYRESLQASRRELAVRFRFAGLARKVVGVGSVGTRAWVVLLLGRDDGDPLLMQVKEAQPSVLEHYLNCRPYANAAERVVEGQRLMQSSSDILLGWLHCVGPDGHEGDYYVRQLHDWKGSVTPEAMTPQLLADYGQSCGHVLARAHARSGDRIAIAGYLGGGEAADIAFTRFGEAYAQQNEQDYATLREAAATGRVSAEFDL
ncbi:DUF2252 domain-containing protein [Mycobacterium sp.]|uniref:DUF2252 domain-containing protein n=1 Tax=Mycobacterium sp. TaxID=1785 RepID=UPI002B5D789A|nr:DUF2252 domain-containing protein [Mycobacterium sp.]HTH85273.1 DUF2252 domain-containing protein [Mycobacterium sp.]